MKIITRVIASLVSCFLLAGTANAVLIDRGNGLIYDDVLDITWLQDANYANTSGYDDDGRMTWDDATAWAGQLVYEGYDDWRLPLIADTGFPGCFSLDDDCGYNVQTGSADTTVYSEMASLFYDTLGNTPYCLDVPPGDPSYCHPDHLVIENSGPFSNLQPDLYLGGYWSGLEDGGLCGGWYFNFASGYQTTSGSPETCGELFAWAVRSGDVAAPVSVPEPATLLLMGAGLGGLLGMGRRKRRR